jgi:hypothetical protein
MTLPLDIKAAIAHCPSSLGELHLADPCYRLRCWMSGTDVLLGLKYLGFRLTSATLAHVEALLQLGAVDT